MIHFTTVKKGVQVMEMIDIKKSAKKRRAKLLSEKERTGWTNAKLAIKHGITSARMSKLLIKARCDRNENK